MLARISKTIKQLISFMAKAGQLETRAYFMVSKRISSHNYQRPAV